MIHLSVIDFMWLCLTGSGFGPGGKLYGFDFWVMVGIQAGGGAVLLLLICVLIICVCKRCQERYNCTVVECAIFKL